MPRRARPVGSATLMVRNTLDKLCYALLIYLLSQILFLVSSNFSATTNVSYILTLMSITAMVSKKHFIPLIAS